MRGTSNALVVLPAPEGPTSATSSPGATLKLTSRRIQALSSSRSVAPVCSSSEAIDDIAADGWRNQTWSNSTRPTGSTRSTAPGRLEISGGKSSTSNTRSNETSAVRTSTRALASWVRGW